MMDLQQETSNPLERIGAKLNQTLQTLLDKSSPHSTGRWIGTLVLAMVYGVRVHLLAGFYIVTYGLGIYLLNLLIGFLSPQVDPEQEGPTLPTKSTDEFRPFKRRLPEFKFWLMATRAFLVAFLMTFFSAFDVPVFWPILLLYWLFLFVLTMKRQVLHMIKYKYVPFSMGKQKYKAKGKGKEKEQEAEVKPTEEVSPRVVSR